MPSRNEKYDSHVEYVDNHVCHNCGSSRRTRYHGIKTIDCGEYLLKKKRTKCLKCGKKRVDGFRIYKNF